MNEVDVWNTFEPYRKGAAESQPIAERQPLTMTVPDTQQGESFNNTGEVDVWNTFEPETIGDKIPKKRENIIPSQSEVEAIYSDIRGAVEKKAKGYKDYLPEQDEALQGFQDGLKPAGIAAGAIAGAELSLPLAATFPVAGPIIIGGGAVLGAMTSNAFFNAIDGVPIEQSVPEILETGESEMYWGGFGLALKPATKLLGKTIGNMIGVGGEEAKQLAKTSEQLGLKIGASTAATDGTIAKGAPKVLGIFPFAGGPLRKAYKASDKAISDKLTTYLDEVAPNNLLNDAGVDTFAAAQKISIKNYKLSSENYERFFALADEMGNPEVVPTHYIKDAIRSVRSTTNRPILESGEVMKRPKLDTQLEDWVDELTQLPENISPAGLRELQKDVSRFYKKLTKEGIDVKQLGSIKKSLEASLTNLDLTPLMNTEMDKHLAGSLKHSLDYANKFHSGIMTLYSKPAARVFKSVDKNVFNHDVFKAGNIEADELLDNIIKNRSPQSLNNLREIVGDEQMKVVARGYLNKAFKGASTIKRVDGHETPFFDFKKFGDNIGLGDQRGEDILRSYLKGTGVNIQQLKDLVRVGRQHQSFEVPSASTFLKRRMAIGGLGAVTSMLGKATTGTLQVGGFIFLTRGMSKVLGSPKALKWLTTTLDTTANEKIRGIALTNLVKAYPEVISGETEETK